jgi:peptidoglycan/LPS O-acetylase OafA/YrhL
MVSVLPKGESISVRMEAVKAHSTGFDYLRILLSTAVLFIHSKTFTLGADVQTFKSLVDSTVRVGMFSVAHPPIYQPVLWAVVPAFFALSGFLVSGSLHRSKTTIGFLSLRALRIFPALSVESLLAMLVLGPLVTSFPLASYFSDPLFREYPLNIIGDIHYFLPGVFLDNPVPRVVNLQLWTIPAEMNCYLFLAAVLLLQLAHWRLTVPLITVMTFVCLLGMQTLGIYAPADWSAGDGRVQVETLVLAFMVGVCLFELKDKIPLRADLFVLSAVLSYVLLWGGTMQYLAMIPIAYGTIFVGLSNFRKTLVYRTSDYSYGVYLYGLPLQQLIVYLFPGNKNWLLSFAIAYALSLVFAAASWHLIESRVMAKKKVVVDAAENFFGPISFRLPWGPEVKPVPATMVPKPFDVG